MVAIARLVVVALLAVIVTACSGPVGTPTSGSPTAPGPTTPWIRVDSFWPGPGATMRHSNTVEGTGEITRIQLSAGLGDVPCSGSAFMLAALTDRPGEFIWQTVDGTGVVGGRALHVFMKNTMADRQITRTPYLVAYLVCGWLDLKVPPSSPSSYKMEAEFADRIIARVQIEVDWHWVPPTQ